MREIVKLRETIERERSRVDAMILNGSYEEFFEANLKLDRLIERYIELENSEDMSKIHNDEL